MDVEQHPTAVTPGPVHQVASSIVHTERFEDLAYNSFRIAISNAQALALKSVGGRIPTPQEQLALIKDKRTKKTRNTSLSCFIAHTHHT